MTHLEEELTQLKIELSAMGDMVTKQLVKTREALINFDKDLASEIVAREKRVNARELKIDRDCENIFALYNPVAMDLRLVLTVLKINNNLERSGDISEGIAKFIINADDPFHPDILEETEILKMYDLTQSIQEDVLIAFENDDTKLARSIFRRDEDVDLINSNAHQVITKYLKAHPDRLEEGLYIISMIRKLERVGDHCKNIAEEIIFNVEAKVVKHKSTKKKIKMPE